MSTKYHYNTNFSMTFYFIVMCNINTIDCNEIIKEIQIFRKTKIYSYQYDIAKLEEEYEISNECEIMLFNTKTLSIKIT